MMNGQKHHVIPAPLGHALYNSLKEPRRLIWYDGGHGDIPHEQIGEMQRFFEQHLRAD